MAQRVRKSPAPKPKARYRVTNWREYNRALVARGAITLWIDEAVVAGWGAAGGKGWRYSDMAILCALSLRAVFGLTLRQTQGFLDDLTRLLGLEITVPHYSTFSRRAATLTVPKLARRSGGPVHLAVDATGLKVYGEGEWKVRMHGPDKRRVWRKLHLAVDTRTGALHAHALTESGVHDGAELEGLLAAHRCADRRGLRRQGLRQLRLPRRHPRPRRPAGDPAAQGRRDPPAAGTQGRAPDPRRGGRPHRRDRARRLEGGDRLPPPVPRRDRDAALQDADRPEPPLAHLRPPEGRGCRSAVRCINRFTALGMPRSIRIA